MAQRRMISLKVIDTDEFLDMPMSARLLYYDLNIRADDDGFVASPKKIQRMIGSSEDDYKVLLTKKFIIPFESGVCVIRHWKIHNYIQKDRYTETIYIEEKEKLLTDDSGIYNETHTKCIQNVSKMETQVRGGKVRGGKDRLELENIYVQVMDKWNTLPLPQIQKLSDTRKKHLSAIIKEYGIDKVLEVIDSISHSDFLTGKTKEWKCNFDWAIKESNFLKIVEGNYENKGGGKSGKVTGNNRENDSDYWNGYDLAKNRYQFDGEITEEDMRGVM